MNLPSIEQPRLNQRNAAFAAVASTSRLDGQWQAVLVQHQNQDRGIPVVTNGNVAQYPAKRERRSKPCNYNFCLTLNSRARAARAWFLRRTSQKMRSSFELTGLRADEPRPRRSIPSAVLPRGEATYPRKTDAQNHAQAARARQTKAVRFGSCISPMRQTVNSGNLGANPSQQPLP